MEKIYYNEKGYVCERYPNDIPIEDYNRYIEVDAETYNNTLATDVFCLWAVQNGQLVNIPLPEEFWTVDLKNMQKQLTIERLKSNLLETDYLVQKYMEGQIPENEFVEITRVRQAWRDEINRLQAELDAL